MMNLTKLDIRLGVWSILLFSLYVFLNPFVLNIEQEFQFQYYWLNYIALVLLAFSFFIFLLKGRLLFNKPFYFILLFQLYSIFVSLYLNFDELQNHDIKFIISLVFCCLISVVSYSLGMSTKYHVETIFNLKHTIAILVFIVIGCFGVFSEDLFYLRRPYASTMMLCFLLFIILFFSEIKSSYKLALTLPFMTFTIISGSRVQLFLMIMIFFIFIYQTFRLKVFIYTVAVTVLLFTAFILIDNGIAVTGEGGALQRLQSSSLTGRSDAWRAVLSSLTDNKYILGNGIFPHEFLLSHGETITTAHNFYLQVLMTLGIIGMMIFLLMFLSLLYHSESIAGKLFLISLMITGITFDLYFVVSYISRIPEYVTFYYILGLISIRSKI